MYPEDTFFFKIKRQHSIVTKCLDIEGNTPKFKSTYYATLSKLDVVAIYIYYIFIYL